MKHLFLWLCLIIMPLTAQAQSATGFTPYRPGPAAPANPNYGQKFYNEAGVRYWYSMGSISYNLEKNPRASRLDYNVDSTHTGEGFMRLSNRKETFFLKGMFGLGGKLKGDIDDLDYDGSTVPASSTNSDITTGHLAYAQADVGFRLGLLSNKTQTVTTNLFGGYSYFEDEMTAKGAKCNQVSTGIFTGDCLAPGEVVIDYNTKVLKNNATWNAVRIGIENTIRPSRRWQLRTELALIPYADFKDGDSHYLRPDFGSNLPNVHDSGTGYGTQLQAVLDFNLTPAWSINIGARYWRMWANQTDTRINDPSYAPDKSYDWDHQRYGFLLGTAYKF